MITKNKYNIGNNCIVLVAEDTLIIKIDKTITISEKRFYIITGIIFNLALLSITYQFIRLLIQSSFKIIDNIIAIFILIVIQVFLFLLAFGAFYSYFFYKERRIKWIIDKSLQKVILQKITPKFKEIRIIKIPDINYLIYSYSGYIIPYYYLKFSLKKSRDYRIYRTSEKESVEKLREILRIFLNVSVVFK